MHVAKLLGFTASLLLLSPGAAMAQKEAKAKKPRVAILDFPAASGAWSCSGWSNNEARMSKVLRTLFTTEIIDRSKGKLRVVERERLADIRNELHFQQSGEVEPSTAQKVGKLLGARYMITGQITRFGCTKSEASTGWGVGTLVGKATKSSFAGSVAGSVQTASVRFQGRLDARLIDVESGEILGVFKDGNETGDTSVKVAGGGSVVTYDDQLANDVFEPIVQKMAAKMVRRTVAASEDDDD